MKAILAAIGFALVLPALALTLPVSPPGSVVAAQPVEAAEHLDFSRRVCAETPAPALARK